MADDCDDAASVAESTPDSMGDMDGHDEQERKQRFERVWEWRKRQRATVRKKMADTFAHGVKKFQTKPPSWGQLHHGFGNLAPA